MAIETLLAFWWVLPILLTLVLYKYVLRLCFGMVTIAKDEVGIVDKKFALFGVKTLPDGAIIALRGEAGFQADTLAPGVHFGLWPWQYAVTRVKFVVIPEAKVGIIESRGGAVPKNGRVLAKRVDCEAFQNARQFLENGGERGPQIAILTPGTYRINTVLFSVRTADAIEISDNMVGVVTTKDGKPLATGDIAGGEVTGHNMYQDGEAFIEAGGYKGLQEQVILAGLYYINPLFVSVEIKPMTEVPIANAGVVIAFVGGTGVDVTGDAFKHGNLVSKGQKGVWVEPLDPGKYPINPYTHKVELVPTANIVLNWATGKTESHKLDANLSTITVRSSDGFKFNLDVSQIIHIPRTDAPKVIARFGSVGNLVTQVLEPTIGNYFRNAAQGADAIAFLKEREKRQQDARQSINNALKEYNVGAVDTLIGDITPPDQLMETLTKRKIAEQEKITFETQRLAEETRKELEQAKAMAATQAGVVAAERKVAIAEFDAQSAVKKAEGDAQSKTINAKADAEVLAVVGDAEGKKITAIGTAEAEVIQKKTDANGKANYALIEVARALGASGQALVPEIMAGGSDGNEGGLVNVLLANLIKDGLKKGDTNGASGSNSSES